MSRKTKADKLLAGFPYERKFTRAETEVILARKERLTEAFRDAQGIQGWGLWLPEEHLQLLMTHGALAGVDVNPNYPPFDPDSGDGAFIRPRRLPDETGRLVDAVEWVVIKDDTAKDRHKDARREARMHVKNLLHSESIDPAVRGEIAKLFSQKASERAAELDDSDTDTPGSQEDSQ